MSVFERIQQGWKRWTVYLFGALLVGCGIVFVLRLSMEQAEISQKEAVDSLQLAEWLYARGVLEETLFSAKQNAKTIASQIREDALAHLSSEQIKQSLVKMDAVGNPLTNIAAKHTANVYFRVENDNNDLWVGTVDGIVADSSLNCASGGQSRNFEKEILLHANRILARAAIEAILNKSDKLIYWQFLPGASPPKNEMSWEALQEDFYKNGLKAFEPLEFLNPVYIDSSTDLSGKPIVNIVGYRTDAKQIIVTQGFNFLDQIYANPVHRSNFTKFEDEKEKINKLFAQQLSTSWILIAIVVIFLAVFYLLGASLLNDEVRNVDRLRKIYDDKEEPDDTRADKGASQ